MKLLGLCLLLAVCARVDSNIWDNVYSQYEDDPLPHQEQFTATYLLREFSSSDFRLKVLYDSKGQRVSLEITSGDPDSGTDSKSLLYVAFDFLEMGFELSQKNHVLCIRQPISRMLRLDLSDLENVWRFFAFKVGEVEVSPDGYFRGEEFGEAEDGGYKRMVQYNLNLDSLGGLRGSESHETFPELDVLVDPATREFSFISIKLITQHLMFKLHTAGTSSRPTFTTLDSCVETV